MTDNDVLVALSDLKNYNKKLFQILRVIGSIQNRRTALKTKIFTSPRSKEDVQSYKILVVEKEKMILELLNDKKLGEIVGKLEGYSEVIDRVAVKNKISYSISIETLASNIRALVAMLQSILLNFELLYDSDFKLLKKAPQELEKKVIQDIEQKIAELLRKSWTLSNKTFRFLRYETEEDYRNNIRQITEKQAYAVFDQSLNVSESNMTGFKELICNFVVLGVAISALIAAFDVFL